MKYEYFQIKGIGVRVSFSEGEAAPTLEQALVNIAVRSKSANA